MTILELKERILKMVVEIDDPEKLNLVRTWLEYFSIYFDNKKRMMIFWMNIIHFIKPVFYNCSKKVLTLKIALTMNL